MAEGEGLVMVNSEDCYEQLRRVVNRPVIRLAKGAERSYDLACELAGALMQLSIELHKDGQPNGLAVDAYSMWSALTDGIDGPQRYARGLTVGEIEELMRLAAKEWRELDASPDAVRTYLTRWENWPDSVRDRML